MPCACSLAQVHQLLCDLGPVAAPFRAPVSPSVKQRAWVRGCPAALSAATPPEARSPAPPSGSGAGSPSLPGRASWPHLGLGCQGGPATAPSDLVSSPTTSSLPRPSSSPTSQRPRSAKFIGPQPLPLQEKQRRGPRVLEPPLPHPHPTQHSCLPAPHRPGITRLPGAPEEADHIPEGLCQAHASRFPLQTPHLPPAL